MYRHVHELFLIYDVVPLRGAAIAVAANIASLHRIVQWNAVRVEAEISNQRIAAIVM